MKIPAPLNASDAGSSIQKGKNKMAKYRFKYWYEWGERDCFLWADDEVTRNTFA